MRQKAVTSAAKPDKTKKGSVRIMSNTKVFPEIIDSKDSIGTVNRILKEFPCLLAATIGLDGRPEIRPACFLFEENGAFYFMTSKAYRFYAELSKNPYVMLYASDGSGQLNFRLSGKACFTEDDSIIDRGLAENTASGSLGERKALISYFLTEMKAELEDAEDPQATMKLKLSEPDGVLIGITIKKKNELRDRLLRILERREAEPVTEADEWTRLYDGALFVFAEAAKAIWPRMDIRPVERAAVFETWDEREKYTKKAAALIGNAVIDKPEDLTYWLNIETLKELARNQE